MTAPFPEARISPPDPAGPCRSCDLHHVQTTVRAVINAKLAEYGLSAQVYLDEEDKAVGAMLDKLMLDWGPSCRECIREERAE